MPAPQAPGPVKAPPRTAATFVRRFSSVPRTGISAAEYEGLKSDTCQRLHMGAFGNDPYARFNGFPVSIDIRPMFLTYDLVHWLVDDEEDDEMSDMWVFLTQQAMKSNKRYTLQPWGVFVGNEGHYGWTLIDTITMKLTFYDPAISGTTVPLRGQNAPVMVALHASYVRMSNTSINGFKTVCACLKLKLNIQQMFESETMRGTCSFASMVVVHCMLYMRTMEVVKVVERLCKVLDATPIDRRHLFALKYAFWLGSRDGKNSRVPADSPSPSAAAAARPTLIPSASPPMPRVSATKQRKNNRDEIPIAVAYTKKSYNRNNAANDVPIALAYAKKRRVK